MFLIGKKTYVVYYAMERIDMIIIDEKGTNLGEMSYTKAQKIAQSKGLDLVEVSKGKVFKIVDKGKWQYEHNKKERANKQKNKKKERKTVKIQPNIGENDLLVKMNHMLKWLNEGRIVGVEILFRGRMIAHTEFGYDIFTRIEQTVSETGATMSKPKMNGNILIATITPPKN